MFQFPGFASHCWDTLAGGFPHSEIHGSKLVRSSPWLIAAYHVLHRLSAPRHPPNTLKALDRSHCRCPSDLPILWTRRLSTVRTPPRGDTRTLGKTSYVHEFRSTSSASHDDENPPDVTTRRSNEPSLHDVDEHAETSHTGNLSTKRIRTSDAPASHQMFGGARRDRTDDLMLAKHALSQLSYGPFFEWLEARCRDFEIVPHRGDHARTAAPRIGGPGKI